MVGSRGKAGSPSRCSSVDGGKGGVRGVRCPAVGGPGRGGATLRAYLVMEGPAVKTGRVEAVAAGNLCQMAIFTGIIRREERLQADGARLGSVRGIPVGFGPSGRGGAGVACFAHSPPVERMVIYLEGRVLLEV